jgi:hypothetical protein
MIPLFSTISVSEIVSITREFQWNLTGSLDATKTFEWYVGEGPLHWYRVEFTPGYCPSNQCVSGISTCIFSGKDWDCCITPSCDPVTNCISTTLELWHVLATSVEHLCERLKEDCCNRKPGGFIRRVQKYMRPALCCDVEKSLRDGNQITDEYMDVDFLICDCAPFIDPCDQIIAFPCSTDLCAPSVSQSVSSFAVNKVNLISGYKVENFNVLKPSKKLVSTRFGASFPSILSLNHNLNKTDILGEFLEKAKKPLNINLTHVKSDDSWQGTSQIASWKVVSKLFCIDGKTNDWQFNMIISKDNKFTRLNVFFTTESIYNMENKFKILFNYNTENNSVSSASNVCVKSKVLEDGLGLFKGRKWRRDPFLKVDLQNGQ